MKKMKNILEEKIENKEYLEDFVKEDEPLNETLSTDDKISYLDFKILYLQYQRANNQYDKKEYLNKYLQLLKESKILIPKLNSITISNFSSAFSCSIMYSFTSFSFIANCL